MKTLEKIEVYSIENERIATLYKMHFDIEVLVIAKMAK